MADEGLFYTQQIDFEPTEVIVEEASDTESFDDYLWMENEEEFEKTEMQRLEEEALMEECAQAMLDEEEEVVLECLRICSGNSSSGHTATVSSSDVEDVNDDDDHLLSLGSHSAAESTLNPLAIEFIPANWVGRMLGRCESTLKTETDKDEKVGPGRRRCPVNIPGDCDGGGGDARKRELRGR